MPDTPTLPLWAGRAVALVGILLVALSLRTAVAAISPIVSQIRFDLTLDSVGLGVIGSLPPVAFALSGFFGAALAKRIGLERLLVVSLVVTSVGQVVRSLAPTYWLLLGGSVLVFAGVGIANILLPPIVKRYFPDRQALLTSVYAALITISAAAPAAFAAPIADGAGWRVSVGIWAVISLAAIAPWTIVLLQHRRERLAATAADEAPEFAEPSAALLGRVSHSRTAKTLAVMFSVTGFHVYACFAWLPQILEDTTGATPAQAGTLLALYSVVALPSALIVPVLAARLRNVGVLLQIGVLFFLAGYLGLLLAPTFAPWLWMVLVGLGPLLFPASLALINLRSRTPAGSVALSGFVQGVGYSFAATGPILVGLVHDASGAWTLPLLLLIATALVLLIPSFLLRQKTFVEDDIDRALAAKAAR